MTKRNNALAVALLAALASPATPFAPDGWLVVHTWPWTSCADAAAATLASGGSALDAVVAGAQAAERDPRVESVGYGAHPDAAGEPTLDAALMCGASGRIGAVGALRGVRDAVATARLVLEHTSHTLLVGSQASDFAVGFGGLPAGTLSTNESDAAHARWTDGGCQPNYWRSTEPPPNSGCGPFQPAQPDSTPGAVTAVTPEMHDTLSMAVLDGRGNIVSGTSTNGLAFKLPGRVGDAAIPGSGNYARNGVGACGSTGDGDVLMRHLPCYQVVESMRMGMAPLDAAEDALARVAAFAGDSFQGALFAVSADGRHAGAAHGWTFQYTVRKAGDAQATVFTVAPRPGFKPRGPRRTAPATQLVAAAAGGAAASMVMTALLGRKKRHATAPEASGREPLLPDAFAAASHS